MSEEKKKDNLNPKQKKFIEFYLGEAHFNGTLAAELSGYKGSKNVLGVTAYNLLRNPKIKAEIDMVLSAMTMPANVVLTRLTEIAEGKVTDFLDDDKRFDLKKAKEAKKDGLLKKVKFKRTVRETKAEVNDDIQSILETDEIEAFNKIEIIYEEVEFELHSAHEALRDLGKHHKLFTDKVEHSGDVGLVQKEAHDLSKLSKDELDAFEKLLEKTNAI